MGIKLVAFDLDGTLTQHKTRLEAENRSVLEALAARYRLVMVGAGDALRIFSQLDGFPIDVIGNYGLQTGSYRPESAALDIVEDRKLPCDRSSVAERITALRERFGFTRYDGASVEFHDSGIVTFPLLGTAAALKEKLAFDPDRSRRRAVLPAVSAAFPEYTVFVGGTSSFDLAPMPYNKYYALDRYCQMHGFRHEDVVFVGDDYGPGGNDESVYRSDFRFIPIDDYRNLASCVRPLL